MPYVGMEEQHCTLLICVVVCVHSDTRNEVRGDMIEVYKFCHGLYTVDRGILVMTNSSITRGHNLKLSRLLP